MGPVRVRVEGIGGGADAQSPNANLVGYAYGGGLLADTLLFDAHRFGLGLAAGYDVLGVSFAANVSSFSHDGAGPRGLMHGLAPASFSASCRRRLLSRLPCSPA